MLIEASLAAQNTFCEPIGHIDSSQGDIGLSITGTFVGTLTLQRSLDNGVTWGDDTPTYTAPVEINIIPTSGALYRIGFKTGAYTSGTAAIKVL